MYLLPVHVLPICHFPIFFVSPEFFPFYLNFLLSYLLFSPNITHHFYMYLCWCHIIPPPLIISPYLYCCHILRVLFLPLSCVIIYYVTLYSPTDISPFPILPMIWQDKSLLILHSYTPSGVRVCPILFVPSYFRLTLSFPPSVIFPFTYYVAMSHSISPSVIFPLSMLLCPTLFPPLLFSLSLCCYVPHYFPPLLFSRLPMLLFPLFFPTVIFPLPMLFCPTLFPPLLFSPYLWRWLYRTDHCWHYTGILLPGSMSHSVSI